MVLFKIYVVTTFLPVPVVTGIIVLSTQTRPENNGFQYFSSWTNTLLVIVLVLHTVETILVILPLNGRDVL